MKYFILALFFSATGFAQLTTESTEATESDSTSSPNKKRKIRYISPSAVSLDAQLVQGNIQRPDVGLVVGNKDEMIDGMLRLRENFLDHAELNAGREAQ